jgi:hypothetical protein
MLSDNSHRIFNLWLKIQKVNQEAIWMAKTVHALTSQVLDVMRLTCVKLNIYDPMNLS